MHAAFNQRHVRQPLGWTVGYCPACQRLQPCRAEELVKVTSLLGLPVTRGFVAYVSSCDFCAADPEWTIPNSLNLEDWSPDQQLSKLTRQLDPNFAHEDARPADENCLRALLDGVKRATEETEIGIAAGVIVGGILGLSFGLVLGMWLYESGLRARGADKGGIIAATAAGTAFVGACLGAVIDLFRGRSKLARARINHACGYKGTEIEKIASLAQSYPPRIQAAVRQVRDQRQFGAGF